MFFHLEPTIRWNVVPVHEYLIRCGLEATIVNGNVHVEVNTESCEAYRQHHAKRIARRRAARGAANEPHLAVRYFPDRFVRNLEFFEQPFMVPPFEPAAMHIRHAIQQINAFAIDTLETEFEIAYRHCTDREKVRQFCDRIQRCEDEKRIAVDDLDFITASAARACADEIRVKLDALLLDSW